jgi:peptide/nickel transport system substrate-binding protein
MIDRWLREAKSGSDIESCWRSGTATRRGVLCLAAAAAGLGAGGLAPMSARAAEPKRGGTIRVAGSAASIKDTLDPAHASNSTDYSRLSMFYNGLTVFDEKLNPLPDLALSVDSKDAIVWTIKLREGVTFHDGSPFGAEDVIFSLMRHKDPAASSVGRPMAAQFKSAVAKGAHEVELTLESPNAELPSILAVSQFVITKKGTEDFSKGIGTGPFICQMFSPGQRSVGVRNPTYFQSGKPYVDQVVFFGITDNAARVNALLSGDIDIAVAVPALATPQIKAAPGFEILETRAGDYTDLIMHVDAPTIGNPDFIQAIKYLQDRQRILDSVMLGYGELGNDQPVPPANPYFDASLEQTPFDPDRAKFHLNKAGMVGAHVPLVCSAAATGAEDMAVILQNSAQLAGLNIDLQRVPVDGYWSNYWLKAPFAYGNINPRPTANILLTLFFGSDAPWNESHWKNPAFDKLLAGSRGEIDPAKRKSMYADMQRMIHNEAGIGIPIFLSHLDAYASRVKGLHPVPIGNVMGYNFAQYVWLDG